ncbi:MAG: RNA methyltransferase [Actinobacteria bacterium]|nr:RNA methyltransferase [Actinomycetota bacterium]
MADTNDDRLADFRALNDQSLRRKLESDEFFIAEGYVAIERLIESEHVVRSVLLAPSRVSRFEPHLERFAAADVPVYVAERETIAEVVGFDMHRGVIASANRKPNPSLDELISTSLRIAVLEGLNDAENLGAISRAARAFGIDGLLIDPTCTDPYSRRTVRVSMGEVLFLPIVRISEPDWPGALHTLEAAGFETWAMTPEPSASDLWGTPVPERLAVLLGAEGPGLAEQTLIASGRRVRIPIRPEVDSLNVGHAAAVTFAAIGRPMFSAQT